MGYLRHVRACNAHDPADYRSFLVDGQAVGRVRHDIARRLADRPDAFAVADDAVRLADGLDTYAARTEAIGAAVAGLQAEGDLPPPRNETYPAVVDWGLDPVFAVDRGAVPALGLIAFGQHVNGVVRTAGGIELWIGRRAEDRLVAPGKLDNLVGGGVPAGLTLEENLAKEAEEEAAIPTDLALQAIPVGAISYAMARDDGLRRDVLFVYDLELTGDFVPRNTDGEVAAFARRPLAEVAAVVRDTDDFKFNVALVIVDFLVRYGVLRPEDPDYLAIVRGLRQ